MVFLFERLGALVTLIVGVNFTAFAASTEGSQTLESIVGGVCLGVFVAVVHKGEWE